MKVLRESLTGQRLELPQHGADGRPRLGPARHARAHERADLGELPGGGGDRRRRLGAPAGHDAADERHAAHVAERSREAACKVRTKTRASVPVVSKPSPPTHCTLWPAAHKSDNIINVPSPIAISSSSTPNEYTSQLSSYRSPRAISGAK